MKQNDNKKHFYLVYGLVQFTRTDPETKEVENNGAPYQLELNAIVSNDIPALPAHMLGRAQQALQMNMAKQVGDDMPNLTVVDVVLRSTSYLGAMTDAEFQAAPQGMQKAEKNTGLSLVPGSDSVQ